MSLALTDLADSSRAPRPWLLLWGVGGVVGLLATSVVRLGRIAARMFDAGPLSSLQWVLLAGWTAMMLYAEGYKGFQRGFSPRVVRRGLALASMPRVPPLYAALAPFYCMSLFGDARRRKIVSWSVLLGITGLVAAMRRVPQPWRGIVDTGVVLALAWGTAAIVVFLVRGWRAAPTA